MSDTIFPTVNRLLLMRQLHALGYAAESAEDGADALGKWKTGRFGLIITDCHMPGMDGYELARRIRQHENDHNRPRTPIIACTANALSGEAEACFTAGMDDCMVKPVELAQMLKKLTQWCPIPANEPPVEHRPKAPAAEEAAVGADTFAGACRGSNAIRDELVSVFRSVNDQDAIALEDYWADHQGAAVRHTAHRIKGAARIIGATALAAQAESIENATLDNDWPAIDEIMPLFKKELLRVNAFLDSS